MKKLLMLMVGLVATLTLAACGNTSGPTSIVGIGPGAGIMAATEEAITEYGLDLTLDATSGPVMVSELGEAIANGEDVIVTGWQPHYKFAMYDLKFLEDPKGIYGDVENIHTVARLGVREDFPDVTTFFENFYMEIDSLGDLMGEINERGESEDTLDIAVDWMNNNEDVWSGWVPEGFDGEGRTVVVDYVNWAEGIAMTNLAVAILEANNYVVEYTDLEPGVVFQSLADGQTDFFLDAWLPVTHESYMDQYGDQLVDLGYNFEGARIGLVVPSYMEADSIEDLLE